MICNTCKTDKNEEDFFFRNKIKNKRHSICKNCYREYRKNIYPNYYQNHKEEYIKRAKNNVTRSSFINRDLVIDYLLDHPCVDCGEKNIIVLEFDHIKPETKLECVSNMVRNSVPWNKIEEEIKKCEVVCANCHKKRTANRNNWHKVMRQ